MSQNPFAIAADKAQHLSKPPSLIFSMYEKLYQICLRAEPEYHRLVDRAKHLVDEMANNSTKVTVFRSTHDKNELIIKGGAEHISIRGGYSEALPDYVEVCYKVNDRVVLCVETGMVKHLSNAACTTWMRPLFTHLARLNMNLTMSHVALGQNARECVLNLSETEQSEIEIEDGKLELRISKGAETILLSNMPEGDECTWTFMSYSLNDSQVMTSTGVRTLSN
jgi:hypothetical protein